MEDCIFCKIVSKEIPSEVIYENKGAIAFLDIEPLSEGHTLIVPKKHFERSHEMDSESWLDVSDALEMVSKKIVSVLGVRNYNILQNNGKDAGQEVMHVHFHIIPKNKEKGLEIKWKSQKQDIKSTAKLLTE